MRLYFHYCPSGFSNCYILGTDSPENNPEPTDSKEAIIIDPGTMDLEVLNIIEDNNYSLRGVLITHDHSHHIHGLKTIMRIYDTEIFAVNPAVKDLRATLVRDGEIIDIGPFKVEVISIPGHSADSAVYRVDNLLFTGDTLSAGLTGSTASSYAAATQIVALRSKLFSLPGDYTILPGHGPPTSLEAERRFNLDLNSFDQQKNRRPVFKVEF